MAALFCITVKSALQIYVLIPIIFKASFSSVHLSCIYNIPLLYSIYDGQVLHDFRIFVSGYQSFYIFKLSIAISISIYFCESSCLFYLSFNFDFYVSKIMHL